MFYNIEEKREMTDVEVAEFVEMLRTESIPAEVLNELVDIALVDAIDETVAQMDDLTDRFGEDAMRQVLFDGWVNTDDSLAQTAIVILTLSVALRRALAGQDVKTGAAL